MCPYIAGPKNYQNPPPELKSLIENDGIFISIGMMIPLAAICKCLDVRTPADPVLLVLLVLPLLPPSPLPSPQRQPP